MRLNNFCPSGDPCPQVSPKGKKNNNNWKVDILGAPVAQCVIEEVVSLRTGQWTSKDWEGEQTQEEKCGWRLRGGLWKHRDSVLLHRAPSQRPSCQGPWLPGSLGRENFRSGVETQALSLWGGFCVTAWPWGNRDALVSLRSSSNHVASAFLRAQPFGKAVWGESILPRWILEGKIKKIQTSETPPLQHMCDE